VFAERLVEPARHIEVQLLGDQHGHLVHLFERDCSVQRRHQKLIEEAPAACLPAATREQLSESALRLARAINYTNAGTVEFLLAPDGRFFFLEVNARLQVEHPVTEAVTGLDLVELQLRIAAGEPLPFDQSDLTCTGHAIEARLYAEDPAHDFLPSAGRLHRFQPGLMPGIRYESSVESGSIVSPEYDALLSKLIAHAPSREEATQRLSRALQELQVHGVATNRDCLLAVLGSPEFQSAAVSTSLLEQQPALCAPIPPPDVIDSHAVAAALVLRHRRHSAVRVLRFVPPDWRNLPGRSVSVAFRSHTVRYVVRPDAELRVSVGDREYAAHVAAIDSDWIDLELDARRARYAVHVVGDHIYVNALGLQSSFEELPRFAPSEAERDPLQAGSAAPLPGTVISVHVAAGDQVVAGQTLVVLEVMKIEHRILAEADGLVSAVHVSPGQRVDAHQVLVVLAQDS
jgi:propionyl-CoA carboxylase alpha chain